ncbi:RING finger and transmembrane domain-containing protein 2 [Dirofilaria immitis]|nr:RING finger and transmembrane domain-containing protein 2 [Dirofilaria immitis]
MGEERSTQSQQTTIWHGARLRDSFLTVVQNAGSQEIRNGLVEDFRTALDMLTQAAPVSNLSSIELESRNERADTVIVVDEDSASSTSSGSGARHRLASNVSGIQFGRSTADVIDNSEEYSLRMMVLLIRIFRGIEPFKNTRSEIGFNLYTNGFYVSSYESDHFFSTLHVVLVVDFAVKIITVALKAGLTVLPTKFIGNRRLRRLFQWIEYTSQFYRYILPIPQWTRYLSYSLFSTPVTYFGDHFFAVLYVIYKACLIQVIGRRWFESTRRTFRLTSVGSKVSVGEEDSTQCTICFNDFCNPIRLSCGHIFCEECIGTWLDNEHTCPMCRATVAQEDNMWKSGDTTYSPQLC